ncbi:hypothetical protein NMT12_50151 [metagenome]
MLLEDRLVEIQKLHQAFSNQILFWLQQSPKEKTTLQESVYLLELIREYPFELMISIPSPIKIKIHKNRKFCKRDNLSKEFWKKHQVIIVLDIENFLNNKASSLNENKSHDIICRGK